MITNMKVKRLEWTDREGFPPPSWCAETGFGEYVIVIADGAAEAVFIMYGFDEQTDIYYEEGEVIDLLIGDAMAACQEHFEELVLECLEVLDDSE